MSTLSNFSIVIIFSIIFLSVYGQQNNDLCPNIISVLCIKDILLDISSASKEINNIGGEIQRDIYENEPNSITLDGYVNRTIVHIRSRISSKHHYQYMEVNNNIDRTGLINLIKEENYAFSYLYNSIENILKIENIFENSVNKSFEKILCILRKKILCNYRNILYIYSETWLEMNEINGIQILKTRKRTAPSILHKTYSIIILKLLEEWMKHVNDFVVNIDKKL